MSKSNPFHLLAKDGSDKNFIVADMGRTINLADTSFPSYMKNLPLTESLSPL